ncbi:MAG: L-histidine N(alpha)-methyltransferase [Nanoarchaeota archaeon]
MQINDLIFKELLKRGYSLDGKTRVWNIADSKLWYLIPEQAQAYLDLVSTASYKKQVGPKELTLLNEYLNEIIKEAGMKPLNIIDLGCGDGKKAAIFLREMQNKGIKVRYCPIDISGHMVKHAIKEVEKIDNAEIIKVQWNISDFENLQNVVPLLKRDEYKTNFFLLLGNTFGNFETHELLYSVRNSMRDGDLILIGNGLNNYKMEEDIVKSCRENPLRNEFFSLILKLIGFKKDQIEYCVRFKNDRLETFYTVLKDFTISFRDKKLKFDKGDQIIVGFAYHYKKDEFISYLKMYFGDVEIFTSKDDSYTLALCTK